MIELPIKNTDRSYRLNPGKILALGLNYREHVEESVSIIASGCKPSVPLEPVVFSKASSSLIGDGDKIVIPDFVKNYASNKNPLRTDYEAEIAFVINKTCRNVREKDALGFVLGYTCLNDVSQRNIQTGDKSGWFRGKSLDTFCPVGPVLVLSKDVGDPQNLDIKCRLNGRVVQNGNTSQMIFNIKKIISILSQWFTLEEGDLNKYWHPKRGWKY